MGTRYNPDQFTSDSLTRMLDGTNELDHWWVTAPFRVDGMPPVVRIERYSGCGMQSAVIRYIHPLTGPKRSVVKVSSLQWCGSGANPSRVL